MFVIHVAISNNVTSKIENLPTYVYSSQNKVKSSIVSFYLDRYQANSTRCSVIIE